jgi:hypothetical protein
MRGRRPVTGRVAAALTAPALLAVVLPPALAAPSHDTVAAVPAGLRDELAAAGTTCSDLPKAVLAAQLQVASGFNPDAVAPDGRRGIAGFSPSAWTHWGEDADGDGTASALDPADAVDALARKMCALYRLAVSSELRGDRLSLALAASEVGWSVVRQAGGVPAAARSYVNGIWGLAGTVGPGARGVFGESAASRLVRPQAPSNPRGPLEAMRWARGQVGGDPKLYQLCLNFMAQSYGWSYSGTRYAIDHCWIVPAHLRHPGDRNPPPGALLYWDTGLRAGHVALSLGDGMIASNDIGSPGHISVVPASLVEARWGARYLGWTSPYFPGAGYN